MRKFNWKALLIVVLAFVMIFTLVACNKGDNEDPSGPSGGTSTKDITTAEYFNTMWDLTSKIGGEEIPEGKNLYLGADLAIDLGTREYTWGKSSDGKTTVVTGFKNEDSAEIGVKLQAIIDSTSADSHGTAFKASLYSGDEQIVGLYYALATPDNIYVDFAGQHILFPLHFDITLKEGDKDVTYNNSTLGTLLKGALGTDFSIGGMTLNVKNILAAITKDMGEGWSLDTLVNAILPVVGLNVDDLLDQLGNGGLGEFTDSLKDPTTGKLSIKSALSNPLVESLLGVTAKQQGNKYTLSSISTGMLADTLIKANICSSTADPLVNVIFENNNGEFKDGVTISLDIEDMALDYDNHPFVAIKIKDMEFGNADNHPITVKASDYTENAQFEIKESFSAKGVKFNGEELKNIELGAKFKLDLKTTDAKTNGTQANVYLKYGDKNIAEASYIGGTLALKVEQTVKVGGFGLQEIFPYFGNMLYAGLKDGLFQGNASDPILTAIENALFADAQGGGKDHSKLDPDFKGIAITGVDPVKLYDMALSAIAAQIQKMLPPATLTTPSADSSADAAPTAPMTFRTNSISDLLYMALQNAVKSLDDGKVVLGNDNMLQLVCDFVNKMFGLPDNNGNPGWTPAKSMTALKSMILGAIQPPADYTEGAEQYLERELQEVFTGTDGNYIHLGIDGVDFSKKGESTYLEYLISSLLTNLDATLTLDCSGNKGIAWSVEANAAGATLKYDSLITATTNPAKQADLAAGITAENAAAQGWAYVDISAMFAPSQNN